MKFITSPFNNRSFFGNILIIIAVLFSCQSRENLELNENSITKLGWTAEVNGVSENPKLENHLSRNKETLTLGSWNIQNLGRTKTTEDIFEIANTLRDFDIVAIQEVVAKDPAGAQAVAKIADELNRMGAKWDYQISDPTKSPSVYMSERYAYLWKTSRVEIIHKAYLDKELEDFCYREPFIASFKSKKNGKKFVVVNYHSRKYNDRPEEEIIHFLEYPQKFKTERILIAGDFNLSETHEVWKPFYRRGFNSALQNERTTLKMNCNNGDYRSHPIDNIYFHKGISFHNSGSVDIVKECGNLNRAREISDHLPVFMQFKINDADDFQDN